MKNEYFGIGLMSGTSLDGIDLAFCKFQENKYEIFEAQTIPYSDQWISRLANLPSQNALSFWKTHVYLGHLLGETLSNFIKSNKIKPDFVASHGHTIFHNPNEKYTCQIGCGQTIVSYLNCYLVNDFRSQDVSLNGQGAPLVPFGEKYLFHEYEIFLNLGGFSNISVFDRKNEYYRAFDICGCNLVLNYFSHLYDGRSYDSEGEIARNGDLNIELLEDLDSFGYYEYPSSLGKEWLDENVFPLLLKKENCINNILRTYTEHIANQICSQLKNEVLLNNSKNSKILITGGGVYNTFLIERLKEKLDQINVEITIPDKKTIEFKEALIFAYLGLQTLKHQVNTIQSVTKAIKPVIGGSIHISPKQTTTIEYKFL